LAGGRALRWSDFSPEKMSSGGGCNSSFNWPAPQQYKGSGHVFNAALALPLAQHQALNAGLIVFLVFAGIGLFLLLFYVSCVVRFILFDSVIAKERHIRKGWARHRRNGFQLFGWQILLTLASSGGLLLVIGIPLAGAGGAGCGHGCKPRKAAMPAT
jgi:hypothetical protein